MCEVAIERPDGPVVEALLAAELGVIVIAPDQVKNLRGRYGSAGNKDDRFDAYVLADVLRIDRSRLQPLTRDSEATVTLRMAVRTRQDLVQEDGVHKQRISDPMTEGTERPPEVLLNGLG